MFEIGEQTIMLLVPIFSKQIKYSMLAMLLNITVIAIWMYLKQHTVDYFIINTMIIFMLYSVLVYLAYSNWVDCIKMTEGLTDDICEPHFSTLYDSSKETISVDAQFAKTYVVSVFLLYSPTFIVLKLLMS